MGSSRRMRDRTGHLRRDRRVAEKGQHGGLIVAGLLVQCAESLLAGIREVVYGRSLPLATEQLQIVAARTGGHAGVIGAATMVIQHVLSAEEVERHLASLAS